MKKILILILALFNTGFIFSNENNILGVWKTPGGDLVEIYRVGNEFAGKIIQLDEQYYPEGHELAGKEKIDTENPDVSLRERKVEGMEFLWGFEYSRNRYRGGRIYDPGSGKTYYCRLNLENDLLKLRGSLDKFGIAGSTQEWTRLK